MDTRHASVPKTNSVIDDKMTTYRRHRINNAMAWLIFAFIHPLIVLAVIGVFAITRMCR